MNLLSNQTRGGGRILRASTKTVNVNEMLQADRQRSSVNLDCSN